MFSTLNLPLLRLYVYCSCSPCFRISVSSFLLSFLCLFCPSSSASFQADMCRFPGLKKGHGIFRGLVKGRGKRSRRVRVEAQNVHRADRRRRGTLHRRHDISGGSGRHIGSSLDTVVRHVRDFSLCGELFASLVDDRVSSAPPSRSCCPLCLGPGLRISPII